MSRLQYFNSPGYGQVLSDATHYSQAVRIGDKIECAGIGGWDPTTGAIPTSFIDELDLAFSNIELNLKTAGGKGWSEVYKIVLYYVPDLDEESFAACVRNLKKWCPEHRPLLTAIGVRGLGIPGMRVEIEVVAHVQG